MIVRVDENGGKRLRLQHWHIRLGAQYGSVGSHRQIRVTSCPIQLLLQMPDNVAGKLQTMNPVAGLYPGTDFFAAPSEEGVDGRD